MNNQTAVLLIAIGALFAVLFVFPRNENLGDYVLFTSSSVDCAKFPDAPACRDTPDPGPVSTDIESCRPDDGMWMTPGTGQQGRSTLNSPCCQPPKYGLGKEKAYKTCDDYLDPENPIEACVAECCANAAEEANSYDASWFPMARCACSLWCYNQDVTHFRKYGSAIQYITGDLATAKTRDTADFIGSQGDFSGGTSR